MTLTAAQITTALGYAGDGSPKYMFDLIEHLMERLTEVVNIPDAATYTVLAENSGKVHFFPDFTASCTATLPAAAEGLRYRFVYKGAAADAQNFLIDTGPTTNFYIGGVLWLDADDVDNNVAAVFSDGTDDDLLTIVTPSGGTVVELYCDGTNWFFVSGIVVSASTPTFG